MTVEELESGSERLVLRVELAKLAPEDVFNHWIRPELLARWWAVEAENDPQPGGWYHVSWPSQGWHLRGRYTAIEQGRSLGFTWQWDHEPERPMRHVAVDIEPAAHGGSVLTVTHALYDETPADQEERDSHREGWQHFLGRLQRVAEDENLPTAPAEQEGRRGAG